MKKLLLGTVALAALGMGAPAVAADMGVRPLARPAAYTKWTGCYVGGGGGNSWGHHDGYSTTSATTLTGGTPIATFRVAPGIQQSKDFDMSGFTGGVYGGCQVQLGVWVIGAEGDWFANNKEGQAFAVGVQANPITNIATGLPATNVLNPNDVWSAKERWLSTARARFGYAVDKWLFYGTGGAAWMKIDSAEFIVPSSVTLAGVGTVTGGPIVSANLQSDTRRGWTIGGGVEYMLPYNWMIRSEYLYVEIPNYTTFTPGTNPVLSTFFTNLDTGKLRNHISRVGLSYKFF